VTNRVVAALHRAARSRGSAPLLTWYGADGARTELSARSFTNWVDKTANLLLDLDLGEVVVLGRVSREHPGHWMSLIWPLATWQAGGRYVLDGSATVAVIGPDAPAAVPGAVTFACSLHPLGLGLRDLPSGVLDFTSEALARPDAPVMMPAEPDAIAWDEVDHQLTHAQLDVPPQAGRTLVQPQNAWQTLADAVIAPVLGGGSAVIVEGELDAQRRARLVASERITTTVA
jgi:uncharacterized protein (TIGR03089 family)